MTDKPIETKPGIVLMLDALGARDFTIDDALKFIKQRDKLLQELSPCISQCVHSLKETFKIRQEVSDD